MTDQPATARLASAAAAEIERSQQRWRHERDYLNQHRHQLTRAVDHLYPADWRVAGTLLADDSRGEAGMHPLHDQALRTYRVASCRSGRRSATRSTCPGARPPPGSAR